MTKVVINKCFGGFGLSKEALQLYNEKSGKQETYAGNIERTDPYLVEVVEELGARASDSYAALEVVEIPDDVGDNWYIDDYDGIEQINENHRHWG